jgi:hypothetical protein
MYINLDLLDRKIKKVEHVIAGPWVGEFGWELMCYQGYLRYLAKNNKHLKSFIVLGRTGHKILYQDFCTEYYDYDPDSSHCTGALCQNWKYDNFHEEVAKRSTSSKYLWLPTSTFFINYHLDGPKKIGFMKDFKEKQIFKTYEDRTVSNSILIHARYTNKYGSADRNWAKENWNKIVEYLINAEYEVIAIGKEGHAYSPNLAINKLNISLEQTINIMNQAKIIVGTSSGPMHLATLCELPQAIISPEFNRIRYEKDWNPFNTKVELIPNEQWNPSVKEVIKGIERLI